MKSTVIPVPGSLAALLLLPGRRICRAERPMDRIEDRIAIEALITRYCHAVDTLDWDLYRTVFAEGAILDYEEVGGIKGGVNEMVEFLKRAMGEPGGTQSAFSWSQHMVTNFDITFVGKDRALLRAMFYNPNGILGFPLQPTFTVGGWYNHELVKIHGEWKSVHITEDIAYNNMMPSLVTQLILLFFLTYKLLSVPCTWLLVKIRRIKTKES